MWAIRKACVRMKSQPFSLATFRASYAKFERASSIYTDNNKFSEPLSHISDRSLTLKRFYSNAHGSQTSVVIWEKTGAGLFDTIVESPSMSVKEGLYKWLERGEDLSKCEISLAMPEFRNRKMYLKALQLSELLETQRNLKFEVRYYASRVDLVAKAFGLQKAEKYINNMIPERFRGKGVYYSLLANCVLKNDIKRAEKVFNKIRNLKLPITTFPCEQMLLLYKRTGKHKKMADVVSLMEKENVYHSIATYRYLIDVKCETNDVAGMEQILEKMKADGLEPDTGFQAVVARHYLKLGIKEKAKTVLKEMEGNSFFNNRWIYLSFLPIYALLGSEYDVKIKRVWEACESTFSLHKHMNAIDAFGKLKKVEEAEAVFDKMLKIWKRPVAKHYTAMFKVYAENKMFTKGKNLVKRMNESGCRMGPYTLAPIVKFYAEAGELEEVDLDLTTVKGKLRFVMYKMILGEYAKRGDVNNAEKIFEKMRVDGYGNVKRLSQYNLLLRAYFNGKVPAKGFRKRLEADNIVPDKSMEARLAQLDAFKDPTLSYLHD